MEEKKMVMIPKELFDRLCSVLYDFRTSTDVEGEDGYMTDGEWLDVLYDLCCELEKEGH